MIEKKPYVRARIERNCIGDEFFLADIPFSEIYARATRIAREIAAANGLEISFSRAAHPLMLHPLVRELLKSRQIDLTDYCVYTLIGNDLYFFSPGTKKILSLHVEDPELLDKLDI